MDHVFGLKFKEGNKMPEEVIPEILEILEIPLPIIIIIQPEGNIVEGGDI
jgi:hypothetical protein